jgi:hypothetical protein
MVLAFTVGMLLVGQAVLAWQGRRTGRSGGSMASIVTDR